MILHCRGFAILLLMLAAAVAEAQFLPYREFLFSAQPSGAHFDSLGTKATHGVYESEVTGGAPPVKEGLMRSRARLTYQRYPLHENRMWFDIEYLSTDEFRVGRARAVANAESLARYIGWAKNAEPRLEIGLYAIIPVTDVYMTTHLSARQAANDAIAFLADSLDFLCPSIYLFYSEDTKSYASYAVPMVAEARRLAKGKKVIPFIAPGYHPSGAFPHQYASYEAWKNVLTVIKDSAKADGFIMFAGLNALGSQYSDWPTADTSGWWRATKEFLASLRPDRGFIPPPSLITPDTDILVDPSRPLTAQWRKASDAVAYHLQMATDENFQQLLINDTTVTDTTRLLPVLEGNAVYYVRLRAKSIFSWWGDFSSTTPFATGTPAPPAPQLVAPAQGTLVVTTSFTVHWHKVPGALGYHVEVAENGNFQDPLVSDSTVTDTLRRVDSLHGGTTYAIRLRARGINFWSEYTTIVQFATSRTLMEVVPTVDQPTVSYLAQNFPNPFNPVTTIRFALRQPSEVRIEVYNMLGELVRPLLDTQAGAGVYDVQFDASGLASGVYVYRIQTDHFVSSRRLLYLK